MFFGIVVALLVAGVEFEASKTFTVVCAFTIMLYIGTMDDILSLSPMLRFAVEILVAILDLRRMRVHRRFSRPMGNTPNTRLDCDTSDHFRMCRYN